MKKEIPNYVVLLRQARISSKMTQTEVAKKVGVRHQSVLSNWESGDRTPTIAKLEKWLEVFGFKLVVDFIDKRHEKNKI